jgi:hypothetical protein
MNFLELKTRVAEETGLDLSTDDTKIGEWVNQTYQFITGSFNWPWLVKQGAIQTSADITNLTASVNAGATAVTLSSGPTYSVSEYYMIRFDATSEDWYSITAHTAASTSLTINVPYVSSSNLVSGACTIRKIMYALPSDLDRIITVRNQIDNTEVRPINVRTFDRIIPDPTSSGNPFHYQMLGLDSSNLWTLGFYPTPDAIINLQLRYYRKMTALSGASDTPLIPDKFQAAIVFGALALFGHSYIDDTRVNEAGARFKMVLNEMADNYSPQPNNVTVVQPWDTRGVGSVGDLRFPPNFPSRGWF